MKKRSSLVDRVGAGLIKKAKVKHMAQEYSQALPGDEILVGDEMGEVVVNTEELLEIKLPDGQIKTIPKIK